MPKSRVIEVSVLQASLVHGIQRQKPQLINPQVPIPKPITHLTGIDQTMVETAPMAADVWSDYLPWLGNLPPHFLPEWCGVVSAGSRRNRVLAIPRPAIVFILGLSTITPRSPCPTLSPNTGKRDESAIEALTR